MPPDLAAAHAIIARFRVSLVTRPDRDEVRTQLAAAFVEHVGDLWPAGRDAASPEWIAAQEQRLVWATQAAPVPDLFAQKMEGIAWRSKPSWFIVATQDRTVQPERQRASAKRMGATTVELDASHVPMLSQPDKVLDVIRVAAKAVASSSGQQAVSAG